MFHVLIYRFAISGVSAAVIVPFMLEFQERKLGTDKGVSTLLLASCGFDNIVALSGNSLMLGIIFNQGRLADQICYNT